MTPKKIQEVLEAANALAEAESEAGRARKACEAYLSGTTFSAPTRTKILSAVEHEYSERIAAKLAVCQAL